MTALNRRVWEEHQARRAMRAGQVIRVDASFTPVAAQVIQGWEQYEEQDGCPPEPEAWNARGALISPGYVTVM